MKATITNQAGSAEDGVIRLTLSIAAPPPLDMPPPNARTKEERKAWFDTAGSRREAQLRAFANEVRELVPGLVVDIDLPNAKPVADSAPAVGG
jgi:hypothetical protein